ncbi:hypothetical protein SAMN06264364_11986 [Quadrisphaera granulorum]|uniref:Flagellar FliJ protein n=1 Tax=Quadrisphaera granulorum TaxID=317664 RepID=A0A316A3X2_9ACTN|nr:flagellar export protein FliJ [Quadrisphaera granulorum]PWJ52591.1 hypothetical protein BXY45_11986 [Quadrisphaera granulorum]SZE97641.1 hypothetical protein SAMN06264364_11986 [Quadrisphaera granulorum]
MAFRLAQLLRVRQVQADTAAASAGTAAGRARTARSAETARRAELAGAGFPEGTGEKAFAAIVAARGAMAARYAESVDLTHQAEDEARHAAAVLAAARAKVKALERLQEHHAAAEREAAEHADQALLDERGSRRPAVDLTDLTTDTTAPEVTP